MLRNKIAVINLSLFGMAIIISFACKCPQHPFWFNSGYYNAASDIIFIKIFDTQKDTAFAKILNTYKGNLKDTLKIFNGFSKCDFNVQKNEDWLVYLEEKDFISKKYIRINLCSRSKNYNKISHWYIPVGNKKTYSKADSLKAFEIRNFEFKELEKLRLSNHKKN